MINQAYHLIGMYKPYQKFLDFSMEIGEKTCYFIFTVLAFGVTSARAIYICNSYETSRIFAIVIRRLVRHWRINAIKTACFLDDGLGVGSSFKMNLFHSNL